MDLGGQLTDRLAALASAAAGHMVQRGRRADGDQGVSGRLAQLIVGGSASQAWACEYAGELVHGALVAKLAQGGSGRRPHLVARVEGGGRTEDPYELARGSGREEKDVNDLLQRFDFMQNMIGQIGQQASFLQKIPGMKRLAMQKKLLDSVKTGGLEGNPMMANLAENLLQAAVAGEGEAAAAARPVKGRGGVQTKRKSQRKAQRKARRKSRR